MADPLAQVFRPARSLGWVWLLALTALAGLPLWMLFQPEVLASAEAAGAWVGLAVSGPLTIFFLLTLASLPAMRYELTADALVISCGPLLRYRLPYAEITDVRRQTLTPSLWSSMRLPGLALWGVLFVDVGKVYMCATRMSHDLILLSDSKRRFGITPADEDAFVTALRSRLPR